MHIRCPHCHSPIEVVDADPLTDISCPSCGSNFSLISGETASHTPGAVRTIGHFELLESVGGGQFGTVWKARDTKLDRIVAVKIPRRGQIEGPEAEMFIREARAAAQVKHPGVVGVHEVGREDGTLYIVSDFVDGCSLKDWLSGRQLTPREAAELCVKIAEALQVAHEAGVIHRDLKPGNVMMDLAGQPHLTDFGLAKREAGEITMTVDGQVLGTPAYMSPEQARGEAHAADRRSDVYSLGVILFELVTGEVPFRGNQRMMIVQILQDEPPSPRKLQMRIARDLETICLKCLEKAPEKRYQTAAGVAAELGRFLRGEPIVARPIGRVARLWRWCKRQPVVAGLSAAAVLLLVLVVVVASIGYAVATAERKTAEASPERVVLGQAEYLKLADRDQLAAIVSILKPAALQAAPTLEKELLLAVPVDATTEEKERLAKRKANCAAGLMALGLPEKARLILKHSPDPTARSYLVHRLAATGIDVNVVFDQLFQESEVSIRRALLLALGEFSSDVLPDIKKQTFVPKLLILYRDDPDPGVHGAVNWLLRQWGEKQQVQAVDRALATGKVEGSRQWYVTRLGQTMVILRGPGEFLMGWPGRQHPERIEHSFAIASRTVTVELWQAFSRGSHAAVKDKNAVEVVGEARQRPVILSWYDAAEFCNWLSAQEGIPESQWCYEPNSSGRYTEGMKVLGHILTRSGFRLPTEAEWEYACRAGAMTSCYHGDSEELLSKYAWCDRSSQSMPWAVGSLKPNDVGLFDMLGNVWQWCGHRYSVNVGSTRYETSEGNPPFCPDEDFQDLRGGAFDDPPQRVRCASSYSAPPGQHALAFSFRPARTYIPTKGGLR